MFRGRTRPADRRPSHLDVIAGRPHLDDAAAFLGGKAQKDRDAAQLALGKLLAGVAGEYDLVLLETAARK